jgi:exodeoxyribonuclease-5
MGIILSTEQQAAVAKAKHWYQNRRFDQPVFRLFGYAGTGKSTVLSTVIRELGLVDDDVLYMAPTGKAATVLLGKGIPAQTIHRTFYRVTGEDSAAYDALVDEQEAIKARLENPDEPDAAAYRRRLNAVEEEMRNPRSRPQPEFVFLGSAVVGGKRLLVVDEASMMQNLNYEDLCSLGLPLMLIGDDGQLPAVEKKNGHQVLPLVTSEEPDVRLETPMRQGADSHILGIASRLRSEGRAAFLDSASREFDPDCINGRVEYADARRCRTIKEACTLVGMENILRFDQVVCGTNKLRHRLNGYMKQVAGIGHVLPVGATNEKLIVRQNFYGDDVFIANGSEIRINADRRRQGDIYIGGAGEPIDWPVSITGVDGRDVQIDDISLWRWPFEDPLGADRERWNREEKSARRCVHAAWAWAITVHNAQGSEWDNVLVFDDSDWFPPDPDFRRRLLYTAATRARQNLLIIKVGQSVQ